MRKIVAVLMCCYTACCLLSAPSVIAVNTTAEVGIEGFYGSISGRCFEDMNQNGHADDEQGIPDVTVTLKRLYGFSFKKVASIKTDSAGTYNFSTNKWGIYQIEEVNPPGWTSTTPNKVRLFLGLFNREQSIDFGNLPDDSAEPEASISANPAIIQSGASSTLRWSAQSADTVTIDQGVGAVPAEGVLEVFPQVTTTYTLTAFGHGKAALSSVTVKVTTPQPPPPATTTTATQVTTTTAPSSTTELTSTTTTSAASTTVPPTTVISSTTSTVQEPLTIITLASFSAVSGNGEVLLSWVTASERDTAGFNIYRADAADAAYERLNASLIPAQGTCSSGAAYQYLDTGVVNRSIYYYKLEDISITGSAQLQGPVSATPRFIFGIK